MGDLFSSQWMKCFKDEWNSEPGLAKDLAQIKFTSNIGYGFKNEAHPKGVMVVIKGAATSAGEFDGQKLDWDLRADIEDWEHWFKNPPGMMALGIAYSSKKLNFKAGEYAAIIKNPSIAAPFVKSFMVMGQVKFTR